MSKNGSAVQTTVDMAEQALQPISEQYRADRNALLQRQRDLTRKLSDEWEKLSPQARDKVSLEASSIDMQLKILDNIFTSDVDQMLSGALDAERRVIFDRAHTEQSEVNARIAYLDGEIKKLKAQLDAMSQEHNTLYLSNQSYGRTAPISKRAMARVRELSERVDKIKASLLVTDDDVS